MNDERYIDTKTGLGKQDEESIKQQMIKLVQDDVMKNSTENKKLVARIESLRRMPKVNMISEELNSPFMNLKIIKIDIDELMTDIFDSKTLEVMGVPDLALKKKALKSIKYNLEMIDGLLNYMEKDFKRKLRRPFNVVLGLFFISLGVGLFIWLK